MTARPVLTVILTIGLLATPLAAEAQPPGKVYRIGWLTGSPPSPIAPTIEAFRQGMRDLGWVEGKSYTIEFRDSGGQRERLRGAADELVRMKVDLIVASPTLPALAAKAATRTIPIVFPVMYDAVRTGVVDSLARPGGNVTGLHLMSPDLVGKRLQLLKETVPGMSRVALLGQSGFSDITEPVMKAMEAAARVLRLRVQVVEIAGIEEIERGFQAMVRERAEAIYVIENPTLGANMKQIGDLAVRHRLPTMSGLREPVHAGGLMSYGPNQREMFRRAATFVDRILKGAKPADLPVEQPTKFELVINMRTAKALGLTIPPSVLARADEIIE